MCLYAYISVFTLFFVCVFMCISVSTPASVCMRSQFFEVWVSEFTICNAQLILSACIYRGIEHLLKWAWLCHSLLLHPLQTQSFRRPSAEYWSGLKHIPHKTQTRPARINATPNLKNLHNFRSIAIKVAVTSSNFYTRFVHFSLLYLGYLKKKLLPFLFFEFLSLDNIPTLQFSTKGTAFRCC